MILKIRSFWVAILSEHIDVSKKGLRFLAKHANKTLTYLVLVLCSLIIFFDFLVSAFLIFLHP